MCGCRRRCALWHFRAAWLIASTSPRASQMINFGLMPPKLRVPFASLVALVWNVVQSLIANRPITTG